MIKKRILAVLLMLLLIADPLLGTAQALAEGPAGRDVLALPANLKIIEKEAFEGTAARTVIFQTDISEIGNRAFHRTRYLSAVYIPASVNKIADSAFPRGGNFTIYGIAGSDVQKWAEDRGIPFKVKDIWNTNAENSSENKSLSKAEWVVFSCDIQQNLIPDSIAWAEQKSMRPQDRPELYPIDYRFP